MSKNSSIIIEEIFTECEPDPVDLEGTKKILSQMENCICQIYPKKGNGTGFFCKIPFPNENNLLNVLITNNHILDEEAIKNNKKIEFIMFNKEKKIKKEIIMDESRKRYTFKNEKEGIDITIIEIKPNIDNINNFLEIDDEVLELECRRKSIYVLHYPNTKKLVSYGLINDITGSKKISHNCNTESGSSGGPILSLNTFKVIGVHFAGVNNYRNIKYNYGTYINYVVKEFNKQYKDEINLTYFAEKEDTVNIFGFNFVKNNKNNIDLIINGKENNLVGKYLLKKGENNIKLIIKNKITNLEHMFDKCSCLKNIDGLKNLDVKDVNSLESMFWGCSLLSDINCLEDWNVSNVINCESMFRGCSLLSDINGLKNWNVSNVNNCESMFRECSSLKDINGLKDWNVSNVNNLGGIFYQCSSLSDINGLKDWNVSNVNNFRGMFNECSSLLNLNGLKNWNVSKAIYFEGMFCKCSSLTDINGLKDWNVSNVNNFRGMFGGCSSLSDINGLKNWNVSKAYNFSHMFLGCVSSINLETLKNWNLPDYMYNSMK